MARRLHTTKKVRIRSPPRRSTHRQCSREGTDPPVAAAAEGQRAERGGLQLYRQQELELFRPDDGIYLLFNLTALKTTKEISREGAAA